MFYTLAVKVNYRRRIPTYPDSVFNSLVRIQVNCTSIFLIFFGKNNFMTFKHLYTNTI